MKRINSYLESLFKRILDDDFFGMAAEMGFWFVIGIFPFMFFVMSFFGWLGKKSLIIPIFNVLYQVVPNQVIHLIQEVMDEVLIFKQGPIVAVIGLCITIFLAGNAIAVIIKGLNRAYGIQETRSFIYTRLLSILMVFVNAFLMFISVNLIIFGKIILNFVIAIVPPPDAIVTWILILRWPVAFLMLYIMAVLNYFILPDIKRFEGAKRKSSLPGTLFFCFFWLFGSWCFSIYVGNLNTYNRVYGTIGAFAMLMVWLYYTSLLMLIGGEINSHFYKKLSATENEKN